MPKYTWSSVRIYVDDLKRRVKHMEHLCNTLSVPENARKGMEAAIRVFRDVIMELEESDLINK